MLTKVIKKDLKGSAGMPICVQVVGYLWEDEKCLAIMKDIENEVKFKQLPEI